MASAFRTKVIWQSDRYQLAQIDEQRYIVRRNPLGMWRIIFALMLVIAGGVSISIYLNILDWVISLLTIGFAITVGIAGMLERRRRDHEPKPIMIDMRLRLIGMPIHDHAVCFDQIERFEYQFGWAKTMPDGNKRQLWSAAASLVVGHSSARLALIERIRENGEEATKTDNEDKPARDGLMATADDESDGTIGENAPTTKQWAAFGSYPDIDDSQVDTWAACRSLGAAISRITELPFQANDDEADAKIKAMQGKK